jgi:hypothetical protein
MMLRLARKIACSQVQGRGEVTGLLKSRQSTVHSRQLEQKDKKSGSKVLRSKEGRNADRELRKKG